MESFKITKIDSNTKCIAEDFLIGEVPLTIFVNDKEFVTLLCTPQDLEDLTVGFLFTSGLIKNKDDIKKITLDNERWTIYADLKHPAKAEDLVFKRMYTSGCGRGLIFYNAIDFMNRSKISSSIKVTSHYISELVADFQKRSKMFLKTGAVHSSAVADQKEIIVFREDIGRHNAIDKVIGNMISKNISVDDKIIISSGRISSEVLFKVQKCKAQIVISRSAPTNQSVRLAREMGVTLIGFARGSRMNVYSEEERIIVGT